MQVVLIAAQSLDGFIARHTLPGTGFTSPEDRAWFPACLQGFDCCVLGGETYRIARTAVAATEEHVSRRRIVLTRDPGRFSADVRPGRLEFTAEAPATLLARLASEGHARCALLGGGEVNGLFLAAGLVDEAWITLEPRVFGEGRPLAAGRLDVRLRLADVVRLGPDVLLLKYVVQRGAAA